MKKIPGQASLQMLIDATPNLVEYFRNDTLAPHAKHRAHLTPVPVDETNWHDEQRAWREAAILFDQSYHMPELFVRGPDAYRLLNYVGINTFDKFVPGRAKSFLGCAPNGHVIGECILHQHTPTEFELISGQYLLNWVEYVAESGGFDVTLEHDRAIWDHPTGRRTNFRFGLDGPAAEKIFDDIIEGGAPQLPFFRTARLKIAGKYVFVLRHGMAGHNGVEIAGAFDDGPAVRDAIMSAGKKHGLLRGGTRAYFSTIGEEGWWPYPLAAIYTGEELRSYREWLSANSWEARAQIGGSYVSNNIEDYYMTPWDLDLGRLMKFDHDFVGRAALEKMSNEPHRKKVTLVWDKAEVERVRASLYQPGIPYKFMDLPVAHYSMQHADEIRNAKGDRVGFAGWCGYTVNEKDTLSLAVVDEKEAAPGTQLTLVWGEPNGGTRKPHVEKHQQTEVRVTVAPAPYAANVQEMRRSNLSKPPS